MVQASKVVYQPLGEIGVLVTFRQEISIPVLKEVMAFYSLIKSASMPGIMEVVPAYASIAILFDPLLTDFASIRDHLSGLEGQKAALPARKHWDIPVCYAVEYGIDLESICAETGLEKKAVIDLHCAKEYTVFMTGFLPGFVYLGGLPEKLHCKRLATPRARVPGGSVAIGGRQTGVYGLSSPGGWKILGRTPHPLVQSSDTCTSVFAQGDLVRFNPIGASEYHTMENKIRKGQMILMPSKETPWED